MSRPTQVAVGCSQLANDTTLTFISSLWTAWKTRMQAPTKETTAMDSGNPRHTVRSCRTMCCIVLAISLIYIIHETWYANVGMYIYLYRNKTASTCITTQKTIEG